ncbi:MAG: hypothetical protein U9Q04_10350 [Campylobacterota bacterium]|nr:hypothetical protein [Campylobacterota bacterium]
MLKINDIRSLETIPDYSIYIYYFIIVLVCIFVVAALYLAVKYFKSRADSKEKRYFEILKKVDLDDTKKAAYTISLYGRLLAKDERSKELIRDLHILLEDFKYKKEVSSKLPNEIKVKFDIFMESLDVR